MTNNTYRATSEYGRAVFPDGVFEHEFTAVEEADAVGGGHVEIVPRTYRQLSSNYSAAEQGETFEAAYPAEIESALIGGGHIQRVDKAPARSRRTAAPNPTQEEE